MQLIEDILNLTEEHKAAAWSAYRQIISDPGNAKAPKVLATIAALGRTLAELEADMQPYDQVRILEAGAVAFAQLQDDLTKASEVLHQAETERDAAVKKAEQAHGELISAANLVSQVQENLREARRIKSENPKLFG